MRDKAICTPKPSLIADTMLPHSFSAIWSRAQSVEVFCRHMLPAASPSAVVPGSCRESVLLRRCSSVYDRRTGAIV